MNVGEFFATMGIKVNAGEFNNAILFLRNLQKEADNFRDSMNNASKSTKGFTQGFSNEDAKKSSKKFKDNFRDINHGVHKATEGVKKFQEKF